MLNDKAMRGERSRTQDNSYSSGSRSYRDRRPYYQSDFGANIGGPIPMNVFFNNMSAVPPPPPMRNVSWDPSGWSYPPPGDGWNVADPCFSINRAATETVQQARADPHFFTELGFYGGGRGENSSHHRTEDSHSRSHRTDDSRDRSNSSKQAQTSEKLPQPGSGEPTSSKTTSSVLAGSSKRPQPYTTSRATPESAGKSSASRNVPSVPRTSAVAAALKPKRPIRPADLLDPNHPQKLQLRVHKEMLYPNNRLPTGAFLRKKPMSPQIEVEREKSPVADLGPAPSSQLPILQRIKPVDPNKGAMIHATPAFYTTKSKPTPTHPSPPPFQTPPSTSNDPPSARLPAEVSDAASNYIPNVPVPPVPKPPKQEPVDDYELVQRMFDDAESTGMFFKPPEDVRSPVEPQDVRSPEEPENSRPDDFSNEADAAPSLRPVKQEPEPIPEEDDEQAPLFPAIMELQFDADTRAQAVADSQADVDAKTAAFRAAMQALKAAEEAMMDALERHNTLTNALAQDFQQF